MPVDDGEWPDVDRAVTLQDQTDAATATTPRGPSPVTDPGDLVQEPHRGTSEEESASAEESPEKLPEFDPKVREDFEGLLYLGRLEDQFYCLGHKFVIRTLRVGEILEIGLLHKEYVGSLADVKAYQAALVAACVVTVDGQPLPSPLTVDPTDTALRNRFEYILSNWYPSILDVIYQRYLELESRTQAVMDAMGNPSR